MFRVLRSAIEKKKVPYMLLNEKWLKLRLPVMVTDKHEAKAKV